MEMEIVSAGGKKVNALYKGFTIMTDQSEDYGGEGTAPEPFDLFLASIGTCAGINVVVFCQKRGIPSENIKLTLWFERNPDTKMIGKISIEMQLHPDFPDKYREAVKRAVNLCAVKKYLTTPPEFEIIL